MNPSPSPPTLWRTCRVLANDTRLRLFAQLVRKQPQTVTQLAAQLALTLPVASQSLRALESRGLLIVKRIRQRVEYRLPNKNEAAAMTDLITALQNTLRCDPIPTEQVAKLSTAFTHPARIEVYRALLSGPKTQLQIQVMLKCSALAIFRHLRKLASRGFIFFDSDSGKYEVLKHPHTIGRALAALTLA